MARKRIPCFGRCSKKVDEADRMTKGS